MYIKPNKIIPKAAAINLYNLFPSLGNAAETVTTMPTTAPTPVTTPEATTAAPVPATTPMSASTAAPGKRVSFARLDLS